MANKPKIRFKGFDDAWEQRKFGDVGSVAMCKRVFKEQTSEIGEIPFYKIGTFGGEPDAFISKDLFNEYKSKYSYPNNGDILISASGSIGRTVEFTGKNEYFQDSNIVWLEHGNEIDNRFLKVLYSVVEWSCEGSTIKRLYNDNFLKTKFMLPKIEEQIKIGEYFQLLDHLITLHQRKYLQKKKTSLTWKQCKLEDVMDTVTDYVAAGSFEDIRNNVTYLNEPGYAQLVRTVDLKKKFTNNDSVYVDESAFKYLWRVNLNDECIVLPNIGANIGEVYFVEPSGLPYDNNVLGPNAILLKANEDTYFAFTALNNLTFQKQLFENVGSSGQPKFNKTELKSIQLYMPQNEEQVKIEQYFRQLDHLITLHRRAHFHRRRRTYK